MAVALALAVAAGPARAGRGLQEPHHRLATQAPGHARDVALTLDACGGAVDARILALLIERRIPATLFVTRRWLQAQPEAVRLINQHPDLFEVANHGADHRPAVLGGSLFGMPGAADAAAIDREVLGGREAVVAATGQVPLWFRGAAAAYDATGLQRIGATGQRVAGFSVNGDDGATLAASGVARRLLRLQPGDIVLAHLNKPASGTYQGLAQALPLLQQQGLRFVTLRHSAGLVPRPVHGP